VLYCPGRQQLNAALAHMNAPSLRAQVPFWSIAVLGVVGMCFGVGQAPSRLFNLSFLASLMAVSVPLVPRWSGYLPLPLRITTIVLLVASLAGLALSEFVSLVAPWRILFEVGAVAVCVLGLAALVWGHINGTRAASVHVR